MSKSTSEKTIWEYVLLVISGFATLVQLLGLISQSQTLFAQPQVTSSFVAIILLGTAVGCIFVLVRTKPGTFTAKIHYYTGRQRLIAVVVLATNAIVSSLVLATIFVRPCLDSVEPIAPGSFGILIADFTEGLNRSPTFEGKELANRTFNALKSRLATSALSSRVELRRICDVRNQVEALKVGQSAEASLVLWGNAAEFAEDTFEPSFTFVSSTVWPSDIDPSILAVELNRVDNADLPSKISARTTSIAAFVIGLIHLNGARTPEDYELAIREFSFAIANTEPELETLRAGSEQELVTKRTLAIFYVMRGRANAALGESQKAVEDYNAAERKDPTCPFVYVAKGNFYYTLANFSRAESLYRQAISLGGIPAAYYGLGNALFYLDRHRDSIEAYLRAINLIEEKGDDPSGIRLILGTVYKLDRQDQLALEQLDKVVQSPLASTSEKKQAQDIIASILNPTPTPSKTPTLLPTVIPTDTPMVTATLTRFPTPILTMTPTPTETEAPTETPTLTPFPTPTGRPGP